MRGRGWVGRWELGAKIPGRRGRTARQRMYLNLLGGLVTNVLVCPITPLYSLVYRSKASRACMKSPCNRCCAKPVCTISAPPQRLAALFRWRVLQVLEGPEPALSDLYARIRPTRATMPCARWPTARLPSGPFPTGAWRTPPTTGLLERATGFLPLAAAPGLAAHPPASWPSCCATLRGRGSGPIAPAGRRGGGIFGP